MAIEVLNPFDEYHDLSGLPLDNGYIYIGVEGQNPETNPIAIFWDSAFTTPAANPVRTVSGYPARNGSPARIYTASAFSITVKDSKSRLVYSSLSGNNITQNTTVGTIAALRATTYSGQTIVTVTGYYTSNDNIGTRDYYWDSTSTEADNGGTIIQVTGVTTGRWKLKYSGVVPAECFGILTATTLYSALLATSAPVSINSASTLSPTAAQAAVILQNIDRILFNEDTTINLPSGEVALTARVELTNPTFMNLILKGVDTPSTTLSSVAMVSNAAKNHLVKYTVTDGSGFAVGDYALIAQVTGTSDFAVFNGCFKVTAVSGNDITVKHTLASAAFPTYTITGGVVYPLKSIIRWTNSVGLAIAGAHLRTLSNVVLAGNFNISTSSPADSAIDGIQIGTAANTPVTGLNESERQVAGSGYFARVGVVEWTGNGVQCLGGNGYFVLSSFCSNGWRGCQAAANGSVSAKGSSAVGNGASGYEAEGGGFMEADNSVSCGNNAQGYYAISPSYLSAYNSKAINNTTHGYESKNNGVVQLEQSYSNGNVLTGATATNARLHVGASTTLQSLTLSEGSFVDAVGATSLGAVTINSGCTLLGIDGVDRKGTYNTIGTHASTGYDYKVTVTSGGDAIFTSNKTGSNVAQFTMRAGGVFRPAVDNTQSLGDSTYRWSVVYAGTGTINTSDITTKTFYEISDAERLCAIELKGMMRKFKFNDAIDSKGEENARIHFGVGAQWVRDVFRKYDLNPFDYALLCYDEWEEVAEVLDEDGNVIQPYVPAGDRYGIRYDELLCFIISAM